VTDGLRGFLELLHEGSGSEFWFWLLGGNGSS
jgi:hypothetical protein